MYSRLLVPLDGSATAELALHHAAALARLSGATLVLLHVIEEMKHCNGFERPQVYVEQVRPGFLAAEFISPKFLGRKKSASFLIDFKSSLSKHIPNISFIPILSL